MRLLGFSFLPSLSTCVAYTRLQRTSPKPSLGSRLAEYLEIAKTGAVKGITSKEDVATIGKDFFRIVTLGLFKTALKETDLTLWLLGEERELYIPKLANHLGIGEEKAQELVDFVNANYESFSKVKPFTLEQTEEIHRRGSGFYKRLDHAIALAGSSNSST